MKSRFFAMLRMTFSVTLNEVKGLLYAINKKLVLSINHTKDSLLFASYL